MNQKESIRASKRSICFADTQASIRTDITEWASSTSDQNIFWLNGVAGSGKSTIATTIAKEFRSSSLGAYILFERGKSEPGSVFRTIAWKLAENNLTLANHIFTTCSNSKDVATLSDEENFEILFKNVLISADDVEGPILIILDGLDECGSPAERGMLMRRLEHDFSEIPSKFRFLIASRPEEDIMASLTDKPHIREAKLDHNSDDSKRDVQAYLSYAMREVVKGKEPEGWDWEAVLKVLGEAANGLFIWASTLVKFISTQTYKFAKLRELVSNPNSHTPDGLYATVFSSSINWKENMPSGGSMASHFSKIFALILFSKEQLTNVDIDGMLGLSSDQSSHTILSKLQSVVAYKAGNPIRLRHTSFYDYLTSAVCRGDPWYVDVVSQNQLLANQCFDVLAASLKFNICDLKTSFIRNDDIPDLTELINQNISQHLIYACRFWAQHLRDVPFSKDLLKQLATFAYDHLFHWFEVLSLTKNFYHQAGQALQEAIDWIEVRLPFTRTA